MTTGRTAGTVLVVTAMPVELRQLRRALSLRENRVEGVPVWTCSSREVPVAASAVGVGPTASLRVTSLLLEALPVSRVIVLGVAGGVAKTLPVGAVVTPERVIDDSTGAAFLPEYPRHVQASGTLLTGDAVASAPDADRLRARRVTAVDMETAAIAVACNSCGVKWSAYRAISDTLDSGLLDDAVFGVIGADGRIDPLAVSRMVVRRPSSLRRLVRLGIDTDRAIRAATRAVLSDLSVTPAGAAPGNPG